MEDVVQILVITLVIVFGVISRITKKKREAFDYEDSVEVEEVPAPRFSGEGVSPSTLSNKSHKHSKKSSARKAEKTTYSPVTTAERSTTATSSSVSKEIHQQLRTPAGAREAFIYTQIFNRKYQ